jgi:hypothetical protein
MREFKCNVTETARLTLPGRAGDPNALSIDFAFHACPATQGAEPIDLLARLLTQ